MTPEPRLGPRANLPQFALLVLVNAFVGGMVGLERTVVPLLGTEEFGIASRTLVVSFIISFGVVKALANLASGTLADSWGRKRVLVLGWTVGLPVPFLIMWAPSWSWIVAANVLLGVNQGLAWSMTVVMKVDLVGPSRRGLAMGLNEFAGYVAVGGTALATGYLAAAYGLRPHPFYLGVAYAALGAALSLAVVRETRHHALHEAGQAAADPAGVAVEEARRGFREVFAVTSWRNRSLFAASQAGLVNNLNDGMSWGIFPLFFAAHGLGTDDIGLLKAAYPVTWGVSQIVTGALSDRLGRKRLIVPGMWLQAGGIWLTVFARELGLWLAGSVLLGLGTGMVYPALLAAVGDAAHPRWRARSLSVYRFWRDLGYAAGALLAGTLADLFGLASALHVVAGLTALSGVVAAVTMVEHRGLRRPAAPAEAAVNPGRASS